VARRLSSAGYAQSNGLAEATVKAVKHLLEKCNAKNLTSFMKACWSLGTLQGQEARALLSLSLGIHEVKSTSTLEVI